MSQTLTYVIGSDRRPHVDNIQDFKVDFSDDNHNWVQARQFERGMRQVFVNVANEDGTPFDLTGCNVWFEGLLPKTADGDFRVIDDKGYVALDPSAGRFRFDMPGHAFTVAGSYRQAFFRIVKNGNSVTTLEFDLDVLADKVIDGLVPKDWIGPFEEIADKLVDDLQKHTDSADKIIADFQKKVGDLIAQLNQQGSTTTSMLTELQNRIADLEEKIKSEHLFTEDEAKEFEDSLKKTTVRTYNTFQDLLNDNNAIAGLTAMTSGYYQVDDGGAAIYEIRSTQANGGYYEKLNNGLYAKLENNGEPINVLAIGVKKDGSEPSSRTNASIINQATSCGTLFFPEGVYTLSQPVVFKGNVKGVSISNHNNSASIHTKLKSALTAGTLVTLTGQDVNIDSIAIESNQEDVSLEDQSKGTLMLNHVAINDVVKTGFVINHDNVSRGVYANDFSIFGNSAIGSIGIVQNKSYDNRYTNIMIMNCQVGAKGLNGYGDNVHIWCGGNKDVTYYQNTVCLLFNGRQSFLAGHLYLDTAYRLIKTIGSKYSIVTISSLFAIWDSSVPDGVADAAICDLSSHQTVKIMGGLLQPNDVASKLLQGLNRCEALVMKGDTNLLKKEALDLVPTTKTSTVTSYITVSNAAGPQEFARIYTGQFGGGYCKLRFQNGVKSGEVLINIVNNNPKVTVTWDTPYLMTVRYKYDAGVLSLYTVEQDRRDIEVTITGYSDMYPVIFSQMLFQDWSPWFGDTSADPKELNYATNLFSYSEIEAKSKVGTISSGDCCLQKEQVHISLSLHLANDVKAYDQLVVGLPATKENIFPTLVLSKASDKQVFAGVMYKDTGVLQTTNDLSAGSDVEILFNYIKKQD